MFDLKKRLQKKLSRRLSLFPMQHADDMPYFESPVQPQALAAQKALHQKAWDERIELWKAGKSPDFESLFSTRYPQVFEHPECRLRYLYLPAANGKPVALKVLFHGHNNYGNRPFQPLEEFDLLAPLDHFGHVWQGSWFWGENGNPFVARAVQALIAAHLERNPDLPWFCMGSCMGGFGALYHGLKLGCQGIYLVSPQIDLRLNARQYDPLRKNDPYNHLGNGTLESIPNLLEIIADYPVISPIFITQALYDKTASFPESTYLLLDLLHRKRAWYSLRVHPYRSHSVNDGSYAEALHFFRRILQATDYRKIILTAS